eukprot:1388220-Amorphochlora_amoeboformis.AAC.1
MHPLSALFSLSSFLLNAVGCEPKSFSFPMWSPAPVRHKQPILVFEHKVTLLTVRIPKLLTGLAQMRLVPRVRARSRVRVLGSGRRVGAYEP